MSLENLVETDVLVIGGGMAGLFFDKKQLIPALQQLLISYSKSTG